MDFIERLFGISPDGGNGSTEFIYASSILIAVIVVGLFLYQRTSRYPRR